MAQPNESPLQRPFSTIEWFMHAIGSLVERQRELAKAHDRNDTRERIGHLVVDVEEEWQEVQQRWGAVKAPAEVLADVRELAALVGGRHPRTPIFDPPTGEDDHRYRKLMAGLAKHSGEVEDRMTTIDVVATPVAREQLNKVAGELEQIAAAIEATTNPDVVRHYFADLGRLVVAAAQGGAMGDCETTGDPYSLKPGDSEAWAARWALFSLPYAEPNMRILGGGDSVTVAVSNPPTTPAERHADALRHAAAARRIAARVRAYFAAAEPDEVGSEDLWMRYMLVFYPPHFLIEPQTSFPDAWEVFCCKALNLDNKTKVIRQRKAPENGIDLYWDEEQIAYQCKTVVDASGKFKVDKAEKSLRAALEERAKTPWKKYVICSNVPLTGDSEKKLKAICSDVQFLTADFWEPVCREHWNDLKDRFRLIPRNAGTVGRSST